MSRLLRRVKVILTLSLAATLGLGVSQASYVDLAMATHSLHTPGWRPTMAGDWTAVTHHLVTTGLAITDKGALMAWGLRAHGLPGQGRELVPEESFPTLIWLPNDGRAPGDQRRVVRVAAVGIDNSLADLQHTGVAALSDDGVVYTWGGTNEAHLMGRRSTEPNWLYWRPGPVAIPGRVVDLISTAGVFLALTEAGDLYTWGWAEGYGVTGQGPGLDDSAESPVRILDGVHSIGAGLWNGWAIRDTTVYWWGRGDAGWDPSGDGLGVTRATPTVSDALSIFAVGCGAVGVVAGSPGDTCGIRQFSGHAYGSQVRLADGTVLTWGDEAHLGTGRSGAADVPTAVAVGVGVAQVAAARDYVFLRGVDGYAYLYGWYGDATGPDPATGAVSWTGPARPTRFDALGTGWTTAGLNGYSGHARLADGRWASWGGAIGGYVGNPYHVVPTRPTQEPAGLTYWTPRL